MQKLLELGFKQSGTTAVVDGNVLITIENNEHSTNLLYAFVLINGDEIENWHVRYIGHTRKPFRNRMYGYQQGNGQAVNNRIHSEIKRLCLEDKKVVIYTLSDTVNLTLHALYIDVAAGLEYSLIDYYQEYNHNSNHPPLQNIAGNQRHAVAEIDADEILEIVEEEEQYINEPNVVENPEILASFEQNLNYRTYWETSNINVPTILQQYFGLTGEMVTLSIISNNIILRKFSLPINRCANANGTPRLYIPGFDGLWFQNWKQQNYPRDSVLRFDITERNRIIINQTETV